MCELAAREVDGCKGHSCWLWSSFCDISIATFIDKNLICWRKSKAAADVAEIYKFWFDNTDAGCSTFGNGVLLAFELIRSDSCDIWLTWLWFICSRSCKTLLFRSRFETTAFKKIR